MNAHQSAYSALALPFQSSSLTVTQVDGPFKQSAFGPLSFTSCRAYTRTRRLSAPLLGFSHFGIVSVFSLLSSRGTTLRENLKAGLESFYLCVVVRPAVLGCRG